jgi:anti-anti-sigma factor
MSSTLPRWRLWVHSRGELTLVRLIGELIVLDEENALILRDELFRLVKEGKHHLALDLRHVRFLTSTMVEALLALNRRLSEAGGRLSVFNLTPPVAEIFAVLKLARVIDVRHSLPEADDLLSN